MQKILKKWDNFLLESGKHFEVEIKLKYAAEMSVYGDVFNKLRAIPGVTIVKIKEGSQVKKISKDQKTITLNVKFIPPKGLLSQYQAFLKTQMLKIKDQEGDKVISVRFVSYPALISKY